MASFVIEGGHKLHGEIHPQGAKNEVLQILCATLLTSEEVTVTNIPDILDVNNLIQLLRDMGVKVSKTGIDSYTFKADTVDLNALFWRRSTGKTCTKCWTTPVLSTLFPVNPQRMADLMKMTSYFLKPARPGKSVIPTT